MTICPIYKSKFILLKFVRIINKSYLLRGGLEYLYFSDERICLLMQVRLFSCLGIFFARPVVGNGGVVLFMAVL